MLILTLEFDPRTADPIETAGVPMGQTHLVDMDGDGLLDVVVAKGDGTIVHYRKCLLAYPTVTQFLRPISK